MELRKIILRIIIMALFLTAILFTVRFCDKVSSGLRKAIKGDGNIIRKEMPVKAPFSAIRINGSINAWIRQSAETKLELIADSNLIPFIYMEFDDEILTIRQKRNLHLSEPAKLLISVPDLKSVTVDGAAEIRIPDTMYTNDFYLDIRGAGIAELLLKCDRVESSISGAGAIKLGGISGFAKSTIKGAGRLSAGNFIVKDHEVVLNGAGKASVTATETIDATINGTGVIEYYGNPKVIPKINGIGRIRPVN